MSRKRAQADAAPPADAPAREPVRFSANCLIGGTGLSPAPGARVRVEGSMRNDGEFTVQEADGYWLRVTPHIADEPPGFARVEVIA